MHESFMFYLCKSLSSVVKRRSHMIDFVKVHKHFGTQDVLVDVSFRINEGERVGIVGPNGAGKSTIFSLLSGEVSTDAGDVVLPKNIRLGHLHQQLKSYEKEDSLVEYAADSLPELKSIHAEILKLEKEVQSLSGDEKKPVMNRLGDLQHEYEELGGYEMKTRAEIALGGLGFDESDFSRPFQSFSGGWQMRAELVRTLIAQPDILMLDEPSNYLDLPAVEWLQRFLRGFGGTMLLVSHDRYLLKSLTNATLEICGGQAVKYAGGYTYYVNEREQRRQQQEAEWRNYSEKKAQLESFINRFRAKSTKASQVQSRIKMLEKMEQVRMPPRAPDLSHLRIAAPPHCGAHILQLKQAGFSYDNDHWIFRKIDLEIHRGDKVAIVGYNGMGKTTLLRILAGTLLLKEGDRKEGHKVVIGYQSQNFAETMPPTKSVLNIIRDANPHITEKETRTLLGSFGFSGDAVDKTCSILSGGEKIRLAFARIFINPPNFLLLDEPTTHLDVYGREALEKAVREYPGTVCLVSHDGDFVRGAAESIISIDHGKVQRFSGGYDYYLEKTAGTPSAAQQQVQPTVAGPATDKDLPPLRGKELRKLRAREREERKVLKRIERELEALQDGIATLHADMASGNPDLDYSSLHIEVGKLKKKQADLEKRWLCESERLGL